MQLEALFAGLSRMTTLPVLAVQIVEAASDPAVEQGVLQSLVERDPVLAARVLRVANSAYYAQRQRVDSIARAVALLGCQAVASMAVTVLVGRQFRLRPAPVGFDRTRLWAHSVAVAAVARLLGRELRCCDAELAYLAGLLHDFGVLVIDQQLNRHVPQILQQMLPTDRLSQAIARVLSFSSDQLGAYIARQSQLPESLAVAIEHHQEPEQLSDAEPPLAHVVGVADYLVNRRGLAIIPQLRPEPPSDATLDRLGMSADVMRRIWSQVDVCIAAANEFGQV